MTSCVTDTSDLTPEVSESRMVFDVSSLTRGQVTTADNIKGNSFAVYGDMKYSYNTDDPESASEITEIILQASEVKYYSDTSGWKSTTQRYWRPNAEHSFVAVHPYLAVHTVNANYLNNTLSFSYTLPNDYTDIPDLMVATHRRMYKFQKESPASAVKFKFFHIMSRINFVVKCEVEKIKITKIELEGLNKTGTFTITPASLTSGSEQTDDYIHTWSDIANIGTHTANIDVDIVKDEVTPLFPDRNAMFLIPQPENNEVILNISYIQYDKDKELGERTLTSQTTIGGWQQGKIYSYSFTVNEEDKNINMSVSVKDWESGSDNNVDVPRK